MKSFISLGRIFFPATFLILGVIHLMNARSMTTGSVSSTIALPELLGYLAGLLLLAGGIAMYMKKYDRLAATVIAAYFLVIIVIVHAPAALAGGLAAEGTLTALAKDLGLMAGAMMYAQYVAKGK